MRIYSLRMANGFPNLDSYLDPDRHDRMHTAHAQRGTGNRGSRCEDCKTQGHTNLTRHNGQQLCGTCLLNDPAVQQQLEADRRADVQSEEA